ncbi:monocarboxylate transporter 13-like [Amphiura filiformis]|uniref:monocarboxylate transporter 13-like n=1 Tax=Amphiura filiformis TaxID=82378 RepID=UPI003B21A89C
MTEDLGIQVPHPHQPAVREGKWRWAILMGAFEALVFTMGLLQTMGVYGVSVEDEFQSTSAETGWIISSALAFLLAFGPLGSNSVKRFGCRKTAMTGGVLTACGFVGGSFASSSIQLFACVGLISGLGASLVYVSAVIVVGIHFHDRYTIANGIAFVGPGVGVFAFPPLLRFLIDYYGWRGSLLIQGGLALHILIGASVFRPIKVRRDSIISSTGMLARVHQGGQEATDPNLPQLQVTFDKTDTSCEYVLITSHNPQTELEGQNTFTTEAVAFEETAAQSANYTHLSTHERHSFDSNQRHSFDSNHSSHHSYATVSRHSTQRSSGALSVAHSELPEEGIIDSSVYSCGRRVKRSLLMDKPAVLLVCCVDFLMSFAHMAVLIHIVPQAERSGVSDKQSALVLSVIGMGSIVTRISHGWCVDKQLISPLVLDSLALVLSAGACILNPMSGTFIGVMFTALVVGLSCGIYYPIVPVVLKDLVGLSKMTTAYGMALFCDGIGMVAGGYFVGLLRDATGDYDLSFYVTGVIYSLASGILILIPLFNCCKEYRERHQPVPEDNNVEECKPDQV